MLRVSIPGADPLQVEHLVLDYNGTLALDGMLLDGVRGKLHRLSEYLKIHIVTADTFGSVRAQFEDEHFRVHILGPGEQDKQKRDYIWLLGPDNAIAIGNGRNDTLMFEEAALGMAVLGREGLSLRAVFIADLVFPSIIDALDALLDTRRLVASLRT